jgi:hypothetical protein
MPTLKTWEWVALAGVALLVLWYFRRKQPVNQVQTGQVTSAVPIVADPSFTVGTTAPPVAVLLGAPSTPPLVSPISLASTPPWTAVATVVKGQGNNPNDPNDNWNIRIS